MGSRWWEDAACLGLPTDEFFSRPPSLAAYRACQHCPVRLDCLRDAMWWDQAVGSYYPGGLLGGLTPAGRGRARRHVEAGGDLADVKVSKVQYPRHASQRQSGDGGTALPA